jgi:hypothetical protein
MNKHPSDNSNNHHSPHTEQISIKMTSEVMAQPGHLSPASHFEQLPLELRLHILSFTHLGAGGDYRDQHSHMYLDIGPIFRRLDPEDDSQHDSQRNRSLDLNLFLVNRQMYSDAFDVLFRESYFVITPAVVKILDTVRRLPRVGLQKIQRLQLRASFVDVELILENAWNGKQGKGWIKLVEMLQQDCNLARLKIVVDLKVVDKWCQGEDTRSEKRRQAAYQYYMFITSIMCRLRGLKGIKFDMLWAKGLAPWMEREVLGDRYHGKVGLPGPKPTSDEMTVSAYGVAHWHQNNKSIKDFDFTQDGAVFN